MQITNFALAGLASAEHRLEQTARELSKAGEPASEDQVDLSAAMVSLLDAANEGNANIRALSVAEQLEKAAINLLA